MELNSRVCVGIEGKQEQNLAIPHCVDAHAKVLASIRWAHKYQVCTSWRERDEKSLAENLAAAYAQWKAQKRAESAPLSVCPQCLQLNLDEFRYI